MNIITQLQKEKELIEKVLKTATLKITKLPKGKIKTSKNKKCRCYIKNERTGKWEYIKATDYSKAKKIAQYIYEEKVITQSKKQLRTISKFMARYKSEYLAHIYSEMSETRQEMINPYLLSNEKYAENWLNETYTHNPYPYTKVFTLGDNEHFRSKSEVMIAEKLKALNIPYKYEKGITINNRMVYPDFTLLDVYSREEVIYEHFGMLDSESYLNVNFISKMNEYAESNYILGKNLLCSFESGEVPLNMKYVEKLLKNRFFSDKQ